MIYTPKKLVEELNSHDSILSVAEQSAQDQLKTHEEIDNLFVIEEQSDHDWTDEMTGGIPTPVLTLENIRKAVHVLRENAKQPFIVDIRSRHPVWNLVEKSSLARDFFYHGIPCILDETVPVNTVRFTMSDGTVTHFPISNMPPYLK
jgi:hypothetical protein